MPQWSETELRMLLDRLDNASYSEIADLLNKSPGAVAKQARKWRRKLSLGEQPPVSRSDDGLDDSQPEPEPEPDVVENVHVASIGWGGHSDGLSLFEAACLEALRRNESPMTEGEVSECARLLFCDRGWNEEGLSDTLLSGMLFSLASCGLVTRQGGFHALTPRGLSLHRSSIPSRQAKPTNFGRKSHAVLGDLDISRYIDD